MPLLSSGHRGRSSSREPESQSKPWRRGDFNPPPTSSISVVVAGPLSHGERRAVAGKSGSTPAILSGLCPSPRHDLPATVGEGRASSEFGTASNQPHL